MKTRTEMLTLRRQRLLAECELQRSDMVQQVRPLLLTAESLQVGLRIVSKVGKHPGWIAAAAIGLAVIRPRRVSALMRLGTTAMRVWQQMRPLLLGVTASRKASVDRHPESEF